MDNERVKPCLECDRLISFEAIRCPFCQKLQIMDDSRTCSRCGQALHPKSIFCPKCGNLTVKTAAVPHIKSPVGNAKDQSIKTYITTAWVIGTSALLLQALLILDYLLLG